MPVLQEYVKGKDYLFAGALIVLAGPAFPGITFSPPFPSVLTVQSGPTRLAEGIRWAAIRCRSRLDDLPSSAAAAVRVIRGIRIAPLIYAEE